MSDEELRLAAVNAAAISNSGRGATAQQLIHQAEQIVSYVRGEN